MGKHGVLCGLDKEDQCFVVGMDGADVNLAFFAVDGDGAGRTQLEFSDERGTQGKEGAADGGKAVRAVLGTVRMCRDFKAIRRGEDYVFHAGGFCGEGFQCTGAVGNEAAFAVVFQCCHGRSLIQFCFDGSYQGFDQQ